MIIKCESCSRKFVVRDMDIPVGGRSVQCGYCSVTWLQMPVITESKPTLPKNITSNKKITSKRPTSDAVKASDGKSYKFTGVQWQVLLPSGKTGIFAKRIIGQELNKLTGRKVKKVVRKKNKDFDPSAQNLPDIYKPKKNIGILSYIFLIIIITLSGIGVIKTFENDFLNYLPEYQYIFDFIDQQIKYVNETIKNIITILKDLIKSY